MRRSQRRFVDVFVVLLLSVGISWSQCPSNVGPLWIEFRVTADSFELPAPEMIGVGGVGDPPVAFKFTSILPQGGTDFIVVAPSRGVTPALAWVSLNPDVVPYMRSGAHALRAGFGASDGSGGFCGPAIYLYLTPRPAPSVTSVLNAATGRAELSAGAMITITGENLGTPPITARYDSAGLYPTELGNTTVWFNDKRAPLLYVSRERIEAVIPHSLAGQTEVDLLVEHNSYRRPVIRLPLLPTSPGIFTAKGSGGAPAILNQDGRSNGVDDPAAKGSVVQIWATGAGAWNVSPPEGSILLSALSSEQRRIFFQPLAPVSLTIGGAPATIRYAGPAPYRIFGTLQVNAVVPESIESGPQPLVLTIGENSNAQQEVTLFVQ